MDTFDPFDTLTSDTLREITSHCEAFDVLTPFQWEFNPAHKCFRAEYDSSDDILYLSIYPTSHSDYPLLEEEGRERYKKECWTAKIVTAHSPSSSAYARGPSPLKAYMNFVNEWKSQDDHTLNIPLVYSSCSCGT